MRLSDQNSASPNNDSSVDLVVTRDATGVHLQFRQINFNTGSITPIQTVDLAPGTGDQIVLRLSYDHNSYVNTTAGGRVTASFDLMSNGVVTSTTNVSGTGAIFQGEGFTQAQLIGQSSQSESGVYKLVGTYGTLTVAQDGQWHYLLADQQANVQALGAGQTATDAFTIHVDDGHGRVADQQVVITVNGSHDAPAITGDLTFTVNEGTSHTLTTANFRAVEPDSTDSQLTFSVTNPSNGHVTVNGSDATSFTQQQLAAGVVAFAQDLPMPFNVTQASFQVSVSDGVATSAPITVLGSGTDGIDQGADSGRL